MDKPLRPASAPPSSSLVLGLLVVLAVATPWPFGSVQPWAERAVAGLALGAVLAALAAGVVGSRGAWRASVPAWPLVALLALAALQVVPVPPALHAGVAPGSAAIWHPAEPTAAAALGGGARPVSIEPGATWRWLGMVAGLSGLVLLAGPALARRETAVRAAAAVCAGGVLLAVFAIVSRGAFGSLLYGRIPVPTVSPFGPFVSKNHFAGYTAMAALLAHGLASGLAGHASRGGGALAWTASPGSPRVLLAGVAAAAMALSVLVSQSRGGAVSLAAGVLVFVAVRVWVHRRRGRRVGRGHALAAAASVLLILGVAAVLPAGTRARLTGIAGARSEASGSFRLDAWRDAARLARSSPLLGTGWGAFGDALPRFKTAHGELRVEHAENDYVETLADGGAAGLVLALLALALPLAAVLKGLAAQDDRVLRGLGTGAVAAAAAALVHSGLDFSLRIPSNAVLFAFAAAVACGAATGAARPLAPRRAALVLAAGTGLAAGWLAAPWARPAVPTGDVRRAAAVAEPVARALRLERAELALVRHLRRRPADAEGWLLLGWTRSARGAPAEGAALAAHARALDPLRPGLDLAPPPAP